MRINAIFDTFRNKWTINYNGWETPLKDYQLLEDPINNTWPSYPWQKDENGLLWHPAVNKWVVVQFMDTTHKFFLFKDKWNIQYFYKLTKCPIIPICDIVDTGGLIDGNFY